MAKWKYAQITGTSFGVGIGFSSGNADAWVDFLTNVWTIRKEDISAGKRFIEAPGIDLMDVLDALGKRGWEVVAATEGEHSNTVYVKHLIPEEGATQ